MTLKPNAERLTEIRDAFTVLPKLPADGRYTENETTLHSRSPSLAPPAAWSLIKLVRRQACSGGH